MGDVLDLNHVKERCSSSKSSDWSRISWISSGENVLPPDAIKS